VATPTTEPSTTGMSTADAALANTACGSVSGGSEVVIFNGGGIRMFGAAVLCAGSVCSGARARACMMCVCVLLCCLEGGGRLLCEARVPRVQ
jgi:urocanate hydratase